MPSAPPSKAAKSGTSRSSKVTHRTAEKPTASHGRNKGTAPATAEGTVAQHPAGVPAPAAVLMRAIGIPATDDTTTTGSTTAPSTANGELQQSSPPSTAIGPSPLLSNLEVEVETKQGYTYTGKLAFLDVHYNLLLHEALVRRARPFDVERAMDAQQQQREARLLAISLQGMGGFQEEGPFSTDALPRARYIGTVYLRSSNVVLMRFVGSGSATQATAADTPGAQLRNSFAEMAAAIKAHLQREKMRKRAARRKRLDAAKK